MQINKVEYTIQCDLCGERLTTKSATAVYKDQDEFTCLSHDILMNEQSDKHLCNCCMIEISIYLQKRYARHVKNK